MNLVVTRTRPVVASDVMSAPAVTVAPTTSVWAAWSLMLRTGVRHLLVAAGERCLGVVDDRAVFAEWPMGPLALRRRDVRQLARAYTTCVLPDTELRVVAEVMVDNAIDAVPVVTVDGRLIGIVTGSDIARAVARAGLSLEEQP